LNSRRVIEFRFEGHHTELYCLPKLLEKKHEGHSLSACVSLQVA